MLLILPAYKAIVAIFHYPSFFTALQSLIPFVFRVFLSIIQAAFFYLDPVCGNRLPDELVQLFCAVHHIADCNSMLIYKYLDYLTLPHAGQSDLIYNSPDLSGVKTISDAYSPPDRKVIFLHVDPKYSHPKGRNQKRQAQHKNNLLLGLSGTCWLKGYILKSDFTYLLI